MIHAHHKDGGVVLGGGAHHHTLGTGIDVGAGCFIGEEEAGALQHVVGSHRSPVEIVGIALSGDANGLAIHHQLAVLHTHITLEAPMGGVVAEHVSQILHIDEVVDTHDLRQDDGTAEGEATNPAKAVNTDADAHRRPP